MVNALKVRKFPHFRVLFKSRNDTTEIIFSFNGSIEEYNPRDLESVLVQKYSYLLQMIEQRQNIERERHIRERQDKKFRQPLLRDKERERQRNEAIQMEQKPRNLLLLKRQWLLWRKS